MTKKRSTFSPGEIFRSRLLDFFLLILENTSPFCGTTDTPVLDCWSRLPWSFAVIHKLGSVTVFVQLLMEIS